MSKVNIESQKRRERCRQITYQLNDKIYEIRCRGTLKIKYIYSSVITYLNNIPHIKNNDMTYFSHMSEALDMGSNMMFGGIALFIHSIFPNVLTTTGSTIIKKLYERIIRKQRLLVN